jgi:hypothetical protein
MTSTKPKLKQRRCRNQFRAWLVYELNARGANLPKEPKYSALREALERLLPLQRL